MSCDWDVRRLECIVAGMSSGWDVLCLEYLLARMSRGWNVMWLGFLEVGRTGRGLIPRSTALDTLIEHIEM
jgi:hypothetical protein